MFPPQPPAVVIYLPERPNTPKCPDKVVVEGDIDGDNIKLKLSDAQKLRDWINEYMKCSESNQIILKGHIEKLENRLKAVGGR